MLRPIHGMPYTAAPNTGLFIHKLPKSDNCRTQNTTSTCTHMHTWTHQLGREWHHPNATAWPSNPAAASSKLPSPPVSHMKSSYRHCMTPSRLQCPQWGTDWRLPVPNAKQRKGELRREERGVPQAQDPKPRRAAEEEVQGGSAVVVSRTSPNALSVLPTHEKAFISYLEPPCWSEPYCPPARAGEQLCHLPRPLWGPALPAGSYPRRKPQGRSAPFGRENTLAHRPTPAAQSTPNH